jgi:phage terminase large subunit-like protein
MPSHRVSQYWIRGAADELALSQGCYLDEPAGELVCEFIESFCCQSKGRWAGRPLELLEWQSDFLIRLFGWKTRAGLRRYRRAYLELPKKNGKSTLISGLGLYLLLADGEGAPEVYLNACDKDQASIIFEEQRRMVEASPELRGRLQVQNSQNNKRIIDPAGNGVIIANSSIAASKDGLNASATIFDELHRLAGRELWDVFEYAGAARLQPIRISITTAGESEDGVWFEEREYSEKVNSGTVPDTSFLGVIYRADPKRDDVTDPEVWHRANPSLGTTISEEDFARELAEAQQNPRKMAGFLRFRLNIVSKSDTVYIDPADWNACSAAPADPATRAGCSCYAGGDLSKSIDLTALVALWGDEIRGYDLLAWFWMPSENVSELERRDRVPYRMWIEQGWITETPGAIVDYAFLRRTINAVAAENELRKALFDPYNATALALELREQDGLPVEFLRQGFLSLSPPTKHLERLVKSRKLRHGGNPVLRWMVSNAVAVEDAAGNVKLDKKRSRKKIDGVAALVNAIAAAQADPDSGGSIYETRGVISV